jgi:hypothetical protein
MNIKLTKREAEEGITLESVNSTGFYSHYSPIQLENGDVIEIMSINRNESPRRFWALTSDGYLTENGKLVIFDERLCRVARARYLVNHIEEEHAKFYERVEKKCQEWITEIDNRIKELRGELNTCKACIRVSAQDGPVASAPSNELLLHVVKERDPKVFARRTEHMKRILPELEKQQAKIEELQSSENFSELMHLLGISGRKNPIFTAKFDDFADMKKLKAIFGARSLEQWNGDMFKIYAAIEVSEK